MPAALAVIRRGAPSEQHLDDAALYRAIGRRHTNRQPFLDTPVPDAYRRLLAPAALAEGADLHMITAPTERSELRCIIAAADRQQRGMIGRAELDAWAGNLPSRPGWVPLAASGPAPELQDRWAFRDMGRGLSRFGSNHVDRRSFCR